MGGNREDFPIFSLERSGAGTIVVAVFQRKPGTPVAEIITCPRCRRTLQVPESFAGKLVQCPQCAESFTAPAPGDWVRPAPPGAAPAPSGGEAPRPRDWGDRDDDYPQPRRRRMLDAYDDDYDPPVRRRYAVDHRGSVILTLGILSLVICGIILGPIAWAMGAQDLKEIRAGRMDREGEGLTNAGMICGMIATILHLVVFGLWFLIAVIGAAAGPRW